MNRELAVPQSLSLTQPTLLRRSMAILLGSLFVGICAHLSVPLWFTPVPLTLQNFAVLVLGLALAPELSAAALVLYLIEGAAGLPVFTPGGPAAVLHIFGPSGGYLLAYPFAAAAIGLIRRRVGQGTFASSLLAAAVGNSLILLAGASWFALWSHQSARIVLAMAVLPFLAGDVLKVIAAASGVTAIRRFRRAV